MIERRKAAAVATLGRNGRILCAVGHRYTTVDRDVFIDPAIERHFAQYLVSRRRSNQFARVVSKALNDYGCRIPFGTVRPRA